MYGNVDHQALILPAGDAGDKDEVTRRTDGQKFRKPLDEGNHGKLDERQEILRGKDG
jgi:hypothetical protein